ncbi:MAG: hypothetical protein DMG31_04785 [Acidobacteria bacterium]|nr:MAG: hypothetical protein DMG31_04785 [Acidobacteriota bacterium]
MKTKTIRRLLTLRLLVIAALTTCAFAAAANAQASFTGKFTLPYEVRWGTAVLPAGDYSIRMESSSAPALVWSAGGENKMFTVTPIAANSEKGAARLYITFVRGERRVRSLNLPELGRSLIYEPLTKNEREILAQAGQVQAVPVIAARK